MKRKFRYALASVLTLAAVVCLAPHADASGVTYKDGDKYVKLGGRIQLQYHHSDPSGATSTDSVFFRRLRPYIEGSVHPDWNGKFQFDIGEAVDTNEIAIKDAYFQYTGLKYPGLEEVVITIGNANFPFSREVLTSSKYQQLVERTFVGDHNYGTPERQLGVHATGTAAEGKVSWGASIASASIDPDATKLDFDTPVNRNTDFNEGWMVGGRVEVHPYGTVKMSQGDFDNSAFKVSAGVAAFVWNNDGDNNGAAASVDSVRGFELSGAARYQGVSVDAEYNIFKADAVNTALTSGIFTNGDTKLTNYSVEGGYMLMPSKLELVAGLSGQDADGYAKAWTRTELGANWFFAKHDIKVQATYRMGRNVDGTSGNDNDELFVQGQYVF